MRRTGLSVICAILILCACGGQPGLAPANAPTTTLAAPTTEAQLDIPALSDDHAPVPTPTPRAGTAASAPLPTEATAQRTALPTAVATAAASPTPPPPLPTAVAASEPVRLVIPAIDLDRPLIPVGLDENRVPVVPKHDVGWYNLSAGPGQGENIVLWGHVLRFKSAPQIPAPFARLKELKPGAEVALYDQAGNAHTYVVTQQVWATPDQVEYILPQGQERVTMVSCIGDKVIVEGTVEMTHRLITIAEPVR